MFGVGGAEEAEFDLGDLEDILAVAGLAERVGALAADGDDALRLGRRAGGAGGLEDAGEHVHYDAAV